jgi:hypothetical protein
MNELDDRPLRKLPVDLSELDFAFEWHEPEATYYLNLDTGAVVFVTRDDRQFLEEYGPDDPDNPSRIAIEVEEGFGTVYWEVPTLQSHESYEFMRDFIETVENRRLQDALWDAINRGKPFRRFRAVLDHHPAELERWYAYKSARVRAHVLEWLHDNGIEPIDAPSVA